MGWQLQGSKQRQLFNGKSMCDSITCVFCCIWWQWQGSGRRCRLLNRDWFVWLEIQVEKRFLVIYVSNSWMLTYYDKGNRHGKIVNGRCSCLWNLSWMRAVFALKLWLLRKCKYHTQFRQLWERLLALNGGNYNFWMLLFVILWEHETSEMPEICCNMVFMIKSNRPWL